MTTSKVVVQERRSAPTSIDRYSWSATFPDDVDVRSESCRFICRCIYIAFCQILACRGLLPEINFKKRAIDGDIRVYVADTRQTLGERLVIKFKGVSDAIKQQYLREFFLVVSESEEDEKDAIEMYSWRLRYDADGEPNAELRRADGTIMAALRFKGMQHLKDQVIELLFKIKRLCRETLGRLPVGASATFRITYTDRTPKGYQAPGFYRDPEDPKLRSEAQDIPLAAVQTNYHGFSLSVQSIFLDDAYAAGLKLLDSRSASLNDSLNESRAEEIGDGDDVIQGDDTMERISGNTIQQDSVMEVARAEMSDKTIIASHSSHEPTESDISKLTKLSLVGGRGSPARLESFGSASPEEMPPKRTRRGRPKTAQPFTRRAKSPVIVSEPPKIFVAQHATPRADKRSDVPHREPQKDKTPGGVKLATNTPKEPPKKGRRG